MSSELAAIYHGVPMVSYPFFMDQPGLAARCEDLGLAVPVVDTLRAVVTAGDVRVALDRIAARRTQMADRLAAAREWELETIRARPGVIDQIVALAR